MRVWDSSSGELVRLIEAHNNWVTSLCWAPRGAANQALLCSSSGDHTARVHNVTTGETLLVFAHNDWVQAAAWSPNGRYIATGTFEDDRHLRVFDATDTRGVLLWAVEAHDDRIHGVAWSWDSSMLATVSEDRSIKVWRGDKFVASSSPSSPSSPSKGSNGAGGGSSSSTSSSSSSGAAVKKSASKGSILSLSQDQAKAAASAVTENSAEAALAAKQGLLRTYKGEWSSPVRAVAWSSGKSSVFAAAVASIIYIFDASSADTTCQRILSGHSNDVLCVVWSPDGRSVLSSSADHTVRVWDPKGGAPASSSSTPSTLPPITGASPTSPTSSQPPPSLSPPPPAPPAPSSAGAPANHPGFQLDSAVYAAAWHVQQGVTCACASGRLVQLGVIAATDGSPTKTKAPLRWQKSFRSDVGVGKKKKGLKPTLSSLGEEQEGSRRPSMIRSTSKVCSIL